MKKIPTTVGEFVSGRLKRSPSYFSEFENMTLEDFFKLVQEGYKKAKRMSKLLTSDDRLNEKFNQGRFP